MKEIAVLLTVFNRKNQTLRCLSNLYSQKLPNDVTFEVFLTNDGCTDGTPEAVKEQFPDVHIIDGDGTLYWNRGMWTAWKEALKTKDFDFFLWLNDDTFLYDGAILKLLKTSDVFNNMYNIIGTTRFINKGCVSYGGFLNGKLVHPNGLYVSVDKFNGNIVFVPRYVYEKIGILDAYYRHCHGDIDYGLRTIRAGLKNYIVGDFLGECNRHTKLKKCWSADVSIIERFKDLYRPTGYPPSELFYFDKKHYGIHVAVYHFVTLHLRVLFPSMWICARHHTM